jgi:hypothetical protein
MSRTYNRTDLIPHWLLCGLLVLLIIAYIVICHVWGNQLHIDFEESNRILLRSILYSVTIILFPVVKLLRHIMLRLNQTMPGNMPADKRYLLTVVVTLLLIESVGSFGFLLIIFGDSFNTLYIFSLLAALGIFLYRPKFSEYLSICHALDRNSIS